MKSYSVTIHEPATGAQWNFALEAGRITIGRFTGKKKKVTGVAMIGGLPLVNDTSELVHRDGQRINLPASQRMVSATHGHLIVDEAGLSYLDASTNGSGLNGKRVRDTIVRLHKGDRLTIGTFVLVIGIKETSPARSAVGTRYQGALATA